MKGEPSIAALRSHNRKAVNEYYDALIPPQLHNLRLTLINEGCDPASRTDQVTGLSQVLERDREQKLMVADDLAQRGFKITKLYREPQVVLRTERVRSVKTPIEHGISEPRGGVVSG